MENPATWIRAEKVIQAAIVEHQQKWDGREKVEVSMARRIALALKKAGLLKEG